MNALEFLSIPSAGQAFAVQVAIGGIGVSALVLALATLLRRRSEPLRYGVLLTGVLGLLAVPALVGLGRNCQDSLSWLAAQPEEQVAKIPAAMLPELLKRPAAELPATAEGPAVAGDMVGTGLLASGPSARFSGWAGCCTPWESNAGHWPPRRGSQRSGLMTARRNWRRSSA